MPQPEFTVQEAFLIPNETYSGISKGLSIPVTYDGAADYLNPVMRDLMDFGNIHMDMVLPGGSYRFGSGSVSAPSISFAADTDNGFYYIAANNIGFSIGGTKTWDYQSAKTETTLNLLPSASDLDLGSTTQRWDLFGQDVDIDTSLTLSFITATHVLYAGTGGLVSGDAGLTYDASNDKLSITNGSANTTPLLEAFQASTGDSGLRLTLSGANSFMLGIDNSDSDKFKVSYGSAGNAVLGTNDYLTIGTDGEVGVPNWMFIGNDLSVATAAGDLSCGLTSSHYLQYDQSSATLLMVAESANCITTLQTNTSGNPIYKLLVGGVRTWAIAADRASDYLQIDGGGNNIFRLRGASATLDMLMTSGDAKVNIQTTTSGNARLDLSNAGNQAYVLLGDRTNNRLTLQSGSFDFIRMLGADGSVVMPQWLEVGTATDAATAGDFVTGLTGAARLFYDQSVPAFYLYNSAGAISTQVSQVASTNTIFNEAAADIDFRVEGASLDGMIIVQADSASENIALISNGYPAFQSMDRGVFLGDASTVPTGNPTGGIFIYSESGAGKARGTGGTITTWAPSDPHCPKCKRDFMHEWENEQTGYLAVCMWCLTEELGDRPWILRKKRKATNG